MALISYGFAMDRTRSQQSYPSQSYALFP